MSHRNDFLFSCFRFKKFKIENCGKGTPTAVKKLLKKMLTNITSECCFMDLLLLMQLFRKGSTKDTRTWVECSVLAFTSLSILLKAINMCMESEVEPVVQLTKTDRATFARGAEKRIKRPNLFCARNTRKSH